MANVEIYTWSTCPFCIRAKGLLQKKGVKYIEHGIDGDENARAQMADRAGGRRSLPQIFINDQHIGGCDDLYALEAAGQLDILVAS
jgi:glutaredoxin 3